MSYLIQICPLYTKEWPPPPSPTFSFMTSWVCSDWLSRWYATPLHISCLLSWQHLPPLALLAILYLFPHVSPAFSTAVWWLHWLVCCSRAHFARNFILFPPSMTYSLHRRLITPLVSLLHSGSSPLFIYSAPLFIYPSPLFSVYLPNITVLNSRCIPSKHQVHTF